ncbi:MAG TPA: hypothetical protein VK455_00170 [Thermoplasmata archaeon]|nr:hypothetical protein [Thermoplasmata archaeon]
MPSETNDAERAQMNSRELLLAVAPPPHAHAFALSGWPNWLIPQYRSGGHRPQVDLLEEER